MTPDASKRLIVISDSRRVICVSRKQLCHMGFLPCTVAATSACNRPMRGSSRARIPHEAAASKESPPDYASFLSQFELEFLGALRLQCLWKRGVGATSGSDRPEEGRG